jgi:hypothetical protein
MNETCGMHGELCAGIWWGNMTESATCKTRHRWEGKTTMDSQKVG